MEILPWFSCAECTDSSYDIVGVVLARGSNIITVIFSVSQAGEEEEADKNVTITSGAGLRQLPSDNEPQLTANTNVSYFYNSSSHSSPHNNYLPLNNLSADTQDREPVLTRREILIITLTSIVAVILIVIAAVVVIWKVNIC